MAASAAPRQAHREGPGERLAEFVVLAGMAAIAVASVLPLVLVAIPVFLVLCALRTRSWRWRGPALLLCLLPALVAVLVRSVTRQADPADAVMGYVNVQLDATAGLVNMFTTSAPFDWPTYGLTVAPYALAGGLVLGAAGGLAHWFSWFSSTAIPGKEEERTELKIRDAAQLQDEAVAWGVENVVGRNVISLLSAPPGGGKGWWLWGLARAMQDGHTFFGLPATRMKLLWCTEEGASFARTRERFGVEKGLVEVLQRHEVRGWDWPSSLAVRSRGSKRREVTIRRRGSAGSSLTRFSSIRTSTAPTR
ncbi:MAG TPA: AAA family ATPase, partial [Chloroflexota bacterium]|nr:AAA family ATPase [Chloroflexota bacterium]